MRRPVILLLPLVLLAGAACSGGTSTLGSGTSSVATGSAGSGGGGLAVVATTTQAADFARRIGGDRVQVTGLLKPNVDAHDFEPSPADLAALADADVIVKNGVGLESWLDQTIDASGTEAPVADMSEGVSLREGEPEGDDEGHAEDPHIWQNPRNAKLMVATIARSFTAADPDGAAAYQANLDRYTAELDTLDREIEAQISALTDKKLVTNHDAFGYYVDRYGLVFVGSIIPSFDSTAELSAAELEDLVAEIKAQHVKAVFSETSIGPKTADTIATQAGVKVVAGDDALYGDSLGPEGSEGADYLAMVRHNTKVIVENLR